MPDETESIGATVPTPERVQTALRLRDVRQHERDGGHCWWCDYPWPCPTIRWITRVLTRASAAGRR